MISDLDLKIMPKVTWQKRTVDAVLLGLVIAILSSQFACHKSVDPSVPKNPRDYTWTADTFYTSYTLQTMLTRVWGNSSKNVYLTGRTSTNALMYRYDGSIWNPIILPDPQPGARFEFSQMFGFSAGDLYAVGAEYYYNASPPPNYLDSSLVLHFNGATWTQIALPRRELYLNKIWGNDPSNLWVSDGKSLWRFDGFTWVKDTLPIPTPSGSFFGIDGLTGNTSGDVYVTFLLLPVAAEARELYYFLHRKSIGWEVLDSAVVEPGNVQRKWGYYDLWTSPSGTMYSISNIVFRWQNGSWQKMLETSTDLAMIRGTSDQNIFVTAAFGTLLHFNGIDWFQFSELQNGSPHYLGIWTDGQEAFVAGTLNGGSKTIVLHGK